jgi:hypothetical protein
LHVYVPCNGKRHASTNEFRSPEIKNIVFFGECLLNASAQKEHTVKNNGNSKQIRENEPNNKPGNGNNNKKDDESDGKSNGKKK